MSFKPILRQTQYWSFRPVSISLSPNTEKDDIFLALKLIFQPWHWKIGVYPRLDPRKSASTILEEEFKKYLGAKYAFSFNSGRSAFLVILESLDLKKNDEVLLQAFTCNAAVNPIIWAGLKPVFVDCDERDFNIELEDLKRKITPRSRVVMVQHTFGLPANIAEILEICQKNNLILIEDCAHSLGAKYRNRKIGTFGKAAFFSFSRDKVISSVYGGISTTDDEVLAKKLKEFQKKIGYPSYLWTLQQLFHPVLMNFLILPAYSFLRLGKTLLSIFQWLQILSKAVHWKEKRGKKPGYFPKRLPAALAYLASNQFRKLEKFNNHRKKIAKFYFKSLKDSSFELPQAFEDYNPPTASSHPAPNLGAGWAPRDHIFMRFTIKHQKAHQIIKRAWQKNILIGDWYTTPIAPYDTKLDKMEYILGSCPKAEKLAKITLNLPTHINISQEKAQKIVDFLQKRS